MALHAFSRTELLVGKPAMERLAQARVAVFGIGGVGGYTVEALARSGVGALDLIDDDRVCLTNINRQIYATRKTVGKYKVDGVVEVVLQACHTFSIEAVRVQRACEQAGVPYMKLETDYSTNDAGQVETRLGAFIEML